MGFKSSAKLVVLMIVAVMALRASAAEENSLKTAFCKAHCTADCALISNSKACYLTCYKNCVGNSAVETLESQCNFNCIVSRCFNSYPEAKKAEGCVNSCSENCRKS